MNTTETKEILKKAYLRIQELERELVAKAQAYEPVAIIGGAMHFAGADTPSELFQSLLDGNNMVTDAPVNRWQVANWKSEEKEEGKAYSFAASYLENIELFDNLFFNIPPEECQHTDPQQRLLLETTVEALQSAGIVLSDASGSRTGVFIGTVNDGYDELISPAPTEYSPTGSIVASASGKISYKLNLKAPALTIDTACSSSLTAIHLGCKSLQTGESDVAIAGGVNLIITPRGHIGFSQLGAMTTDGKAKVFDKDANGFSRGEGCGILVLKKLKDAERDGDNILAVIRGSAMNHDGQSNGYTAPSQQSQEEVILEALRQSGLQASQVGYIEAHGTGTSLGDSIELQALHKVFGKNPDAVYLGSIKANLGHTEYAAGMASVFKALNVLEYRKVPQQLHIKQLNPHFNWQNSSLKVSYENSIELEALEYAGVSGFGISGTNVHLVLQRHEQQEKQVSQQNNHTLYLSARSHVALVGLIKKHADIIARLPETELGKYILSNNTHRDHFEYRVAVTGKTKVELVQALEQKAKNFNAGIGPARAKDKVVFIFPGQGSQWMGMASTLYKHEPLFRNAILEVEKAIHNYADFPISAWVEHGSEEYLKTERTVQPALFAIQIALTQLWMSQGIRPDVLLGISMGEIAALHIAGALSLDDAAKIICRRSALLVAGIAGYEMCVVEYGKPQLTELLRNYPSVEIAGYYSGSTHLLAGPADAVQQVIVVTEEAGIFARKIKTSVATHCSAVNSILDSMQQQLGGLNTHQLNIPVFSTVYGRFLNADDINVDYWLENLKRPILFNDSITALEELGCTTFVEISTHPLTGNYLKQILGSREYTYQPTLFREHNCNEVFSQSLELLYQSGVVPSFKARISVHPALPLYAWDKHLFPIPYHNYGRHSALRTSHSDLLVMVPVWEKATVTGTIAANRRLLYCSFTGTSPFCHFDEYFNYPAESGQFIEAFISSENPVVVFDVADITAIDKVSVVLAALKELEKKAPNRKADIILLSSNTIPIGENDAPTNAAGYAWLGLARSLQVECEDKIVHWIDTDEVLTNDKLSSLMSDNGNATIYRNGVVYKQHVHQQQCVTGTSKKVASVLIIGGTSGIGPLIARWYADRGASTIILHGLRAVPAEQDWDGIIAEGVDARVLNLIDCVRELRAKGIRVMLSSGDIRNKEVIARLREIIGKDIAIDNIVYAAGTSVSHMFMENSSEEFIRQADTRITGWQNLIADDGVDFKRFIFISSASGFFRSPGQSPYLFANHWIDATVMAGDKKGRKYTSILFPLWKEIGKAVDEDFLPDTLLEHASNADLEQYFNAIIDNESLPPVVMAARPASNGLTHLWQQVPFIPGRGLREWIRKQESLQQYTSTAIDEEQVGDELSALLKDLWKELLGKPQIHAHDHFFQAGGNSVLLVKLANRIKSRYPGIEIKVPELIKNLAFHAQYELLKKQIAVITGEAKQVIKQAPQADVYPASEEQKQIWIQSQLDEDASLYNLTGVYAYHGALNREAFTQAIHQLASEQEIFRTRYLLEDGAVTQVVDGTDNIPIEFFEVVDDNELDKLTDQYFRDESAYRFDLSVEHSFRIKVVSTPGNKGVIILNLHHIASDGWALGYYTTRLSEVYATIVGNKEIVPVVTELSYKDYAVYQQHYLSTTQSEADRQYWMATLSAGTANAYLKIDNERPAIFEFHGRKLKLFIDEALTAQVKAFVQKTGVSLYAFLQAVLSTHLSLTSGEARIITGTPMSSRIDVRLEDVVGNFVNLLPVCIDIDKKKSFTAIAKEVQHVVADVLLHQLYPFNRIVQDVKVKRDPSRHPVFDILFVLQNHKEADFQLEGLTIERQIIDPEHSKLDLFIEAREHDTAIEFNFEFNDRLFRQDTIVNFWNTLQQFLSAVVTSPDVPIDDANKTNSDSGNYTNAFNLFYEQSIQAPDSIALRSDALSITYKELADNSHKLASDLLKIKDDIADAIIPVAVACGRSAGQVTGMLGSWAAGMVYMPVNTNQPVAQVVKQLTIANCKVLVCNKASWDDYRQDATLLNTVRYCICYTGFRSWEIYKITGGIPHLFDMSALQPAEAGRGNAAYIVFTSGTTGTPKAIVGRHDSLQHFIQWQTKEFEIDASVNAAWLIQPTFDASFRDVLLPLYNGGTLHIPEQETWELVHALVKWIDANKITVIHIVPSLFRLLLGEIEAGYKGVKLFSALRFVFLSGEALHKADVERWQRIFGQQVQLVNFYGSSETTLIRTFYKIPAIADLAGTAIPVGKPIADTDVFVVKDKALCAAGEEGAIFVKTGFTSLGYLSADGKINAPFIADFLQADNAEQLYESGDIGYRNENGDLVITGRADDQVKVHGIRLHTGAVEAAITEVFDCKHLAVIYDQDAAMLKAYYTAANTPDINFIRQHISDKLSLLHMPDVWVPLDAFPLTAHGKTDRALLKKASVTVVKEHKNNDAAVTATEKKLQQFWDDILKCGQAGRNDNFFDLGGNSLNGLMLLSRIHKELKRKITLRVLFANPVLANMATAIDNAPVDGLEPIAVQPAYDYYPVSQAQRRMWILHNMEENSITYNIKRAYELGGNVDLNLLSVAFKMLVAQQDSLRTNFKIVDGVPVQFVRDAENALFSLVFTDLSDAVDAESVVRTFANEEVQYHFDLEAESLLRARLVKLENTRWVLLVNMHHIISDGWSMELLMRELFDIYEKLLRNDPVKNTSLPVQYKDYTHWQQNRIDSKVYNKEREYWLKELNGEIPVLELPADNVRAKIKTYEGEPLYFRLDANVKTRIEELCRKHDVSLFMFLLATVKVLLHKYTGQKDLIVGSPVAGREHPDLNDIIGFFVNMLALRSEISNETTFEEYLQSIRQKSLDAFENQSYPFDKLVEELPLQRNTSRSPLFDITVQVLNVEFWENDRAGSSLKVKPFIADWQRSQFDLSFFFKEEPNSIFSLIEFNNTIYSPKRIERLIVHFNVLLENILQQPGELISALGYITKSEQQQLLYNNNDTGKIDIPYSNVVDAIIANGIGSNIAVNSLLKDISYGELQHAASKLSSYLLQHGQHKKPVAILANDRGSLITAMLGVMQSGNIYMPLDAMHPAERLKYILKDASVEVLVITKENIPLADKLLWEIGGLQGYICIDSDEIYSWIPERSELMRQDLWNYVGKQAKDDIEAGGWISSYTGSPFTAEEMEEYAANALRKLQPHLSANKKVLEIGCSSGLTLFKVAPQVASYTGIDLSEEILVKTRQKVADKGLQNVSLYTMYADEIDKLDISGIDIIIINSVIQSFGSYNYFRQVITKAIEKAADTAILYLGDVQDAERKEALIGSLRDFSIASQGKGYRTKITWDDELFFHKKFIQDLAFEFPCMTSFDFSDKIGEIKNELSLFRFDAVIQLDKKNKQPSIARNKWQAGISEVLTTAHVDFPKISGEDVAYIIYTSGTTGHPKGVLINHDALINQVFAIAGCFDNKFATGDNVMMACRATFDVSVLEMFIGLCHGATLVEIDMVNPIGAAYLTSTLLAKNITWAYLPPSLLADIAEEIEQKGLPIPLNKLLVGVEPIPAAVLGRLLQLVPGLKIVNGYGPTEATIVSTTYTFNAEDAYNIVPIGRPLPGYRVYIVDENGLPSGIGIPGEIVISGTGVANGYINNEKLTADKFKPCFNGERAYHTGDLGLWDAKGNIQFAGRKDRQVKFNGYRIELSEIESKLAEYPGVTGVVVCILSLGDDIKQLAAFTRSTTHIDEPELKQFAVSCLPEFMLPQRIVSLTEFPLTPHGKTDFKALEQLIYDPNKKTTVAEMPSGKTETALLELYRSLLKQPGIGVTDNFFDLGGHSLIATRLVTRAAKEYGLSVPLVNVFIHPTVRDLANSLPKETSNITIPQVGQNPEGIYPLSYAQSRLWIIDHLNPDDTVVRAAYNMVGLFEVQGKFNELAFGEAIQLVIDRHEILRTNFVAIDGIPYQKVHPHITFHIQQALIPDDVEDVNTFIKNETERLALLPFNLEKDVLLRCVHYTNGLSSFVVVIMHHIISDGWSMHVLSQELKKALASLNGMSEYTFPEIQHKDYAAWSRERMTSQMEDAKEYWHNLLATPAQPTVIPSDYKRPAWRTFNGDTALFTFDDTVRTAILDFCAVSEVTLYSFMTAALNVLIHRYTGLHTVTIGSPVSGRTHAALENQLGFYLNNIVIRSTLHGSDTFKAFLSSVHKQVLQALSYQEYPFDKLVEELLSDRDTAHSPFFDIYLALQNNEAPEVDFGTFSFTPVPFDRKASRYDLNFMIEDKQGLRLQLQYNTDLYSEATIRGIWNHFLNIIVSAVADAGKTVAEMNLLDKAEIKQMLSAGKAPSLYRPLEEEAQLPKEYSSSSDTIIYHFRQQVVQFPQRVAIVDGDTQLTYKELDIAANHIAQALIEKGVQQGDIVSLYIGKNMHRVLGILAVLKAGATYLPLDTNLPPARLSALTEDAGSKILLTDSPVSDIETWFNGTIVQSGINLETTAEINVGINGNTNAYILYTSGTTGKPKGVVVTHGNVISLMKHTHLFDFNEHDVWTLFHQYNFDFTVWEIWGALLFGGKLIVVSDELSKDLHAFADLIVEQKVTVLNQTPPVFYLVNELLLSKSSEALAALRYVIFGGDALKPTLLQAFANKFPSVKLVNMYGITETTVHVTCKLLEKDDLQRNHSNIGKPIPTLSAYILDEYLQLAPYGMPGQLAISGSGLSKGYLNDAELTANKFRHHAGIGEKVYLSGDLAKFLPNGDIEYLGRIDHQVKIRGHRIELGEIEFALQNTAMVEKAVVLKAGEADTSRLLAFVTGRQQLKHNIATLENVSAGIGSGLNLGKLPNFMPIFQKNDSETRFMYREIVTEDGYMLQNLQLGEKPVIIDAGANIGMFSLLAASLWNEATIYAFEPMPEIYKYLSANMALHAPGRVIPVNEGLSDMAGSVELHYYAMNTVMSGGGTNDKELLGDYVRTQYANAGEYSEDVIDTVVSEALDAEIVVCTMRTLSDIIDDKGLEYIDLIKIDVEEWEQKLLDGIRDEHWERIGNLIAEVHDIDNRVEQMSLFLSGKGFNIEAQQTSILKGVALYNLKASRAKINGIMLDVNKQYRSFTSYHNNWLSAKELAKSIKAEVATTLPSYMVPDMIMLVDEFPLTANGKLDRNKLLQLELAQSADGDASVKLSEKGMQLMGIFTEVLQRTVLPANNFFEIGGNSLNATQVVNRVRSRMDIALRVRDIFEHPVLCDLAYYIDGLRKNNLPDILPAPLSTSYPLSDAQQRIFTTTLLDGNDSVAYNMTGGLLLEGVLNINALEQAFNMLVQRHEILRTRFVENDGEFTQAPDAQMNISIIQQQVKLLDDDNCRKLILQVAAMPFDLYKLPLIKCYLYIAGNSNVLLVVSMHHIISDGWSMSVITEEIGKMYNAIKKGETPTLPQLNFQYKDYAAWLGSLLGNSTWVDGERAFWKKELTGYQPLALPYDFSGGKTQSYTGAGIVHIINHWQQLNEQLRENNISAYAFLLASVHVLFSKICGQADITIGTPVAGRPLLALEQQVGFYVNTLPVRLQADDSGTFKDILAKAQAKSIEVFEHQLYPFNRIVEDIVGVRNMDNSPLFNVLLVWQNNKAPVYELDGITAKKVDIDYESSIFDLSFIFSEVNGALKLTLQYNSSLFTKDTTGAIVAMLDTIMESVSNNFDINPDTIEL